MLPQLVGLEWMDGITQIVITSYSIHYTKLYDIKRLPELLAPAGNYEKLMTAVHYGADAVYLGGKRFSLRAKAGNFNPEKMAEGIAYRNNFV